MNTNPISFLMKKIIRFVHVFTLCIAVIPVSNFAQTAIEAHHGKGQKEHTSLQLFNGKNLKGWYTFLKDRGRNNDPKKVFTVSGGMIRISGEEFGCITTNKVYENYKLLISFRWGQKTWVPRLENARDNGVLIHSNGKNGGYNGTWMHGIECQIIEGGTGDLLVVGDKTEKFALTCTVAKEQQKGSWLFEPGGKTVTINGGRINWWGRDAAWKDIKDFRGRKDIENPLGEWNDLEIVANGNTLAVLLNGIRVNEAVNVTPSKGRIQIQSEGAEMFVRSVTLTPLSEK